MGTSAQNRVSLQWKDFESNITSTFCHLRNDPDFSDVRLVVKDKADPLKAHKVVMASCSPYFQNLLRQMSKEHGWMAAVPFYIMMSEVKAASLSAILDFMYCGEVKLAEEDVASFLALAEKLEVKGLVTEDGSQSSAEGSSASAIPSKRHAPTPSAPNASKRARVSKQPKVNQDSSNQQIKTAVQALHRRDKNSNVVEEDDGSSDSAWDNISNKIARFGAREEEFDKPEESAPSVVTMSSTKKNVKPENNTIEFKTEYEDESFDLSLLRPVPPTEPKRTRASTSPRSNQNLPTGHKIKTAAQVSHYDKEVDTFGNYAVNYIAHEGAEKGGSDNRNDQDVGFSGRRSTPIPSAVTRSSATPVPSPALKRARQHIKTEAQLPQHDKDTFENAGDENTTEGAKVEGSDIQHDSDEGCSHMLSSPLLSAVTRSMAKSATPVPSPARKNAGASTLPPSSKCSQQEQIKMDQDDEALDEDDTDDESSNDAAEDVSGYQEDLGECPSGNDSKGTNAFYEYEELIGDGIEKRGNVYFCHGHNCSYMTKTKMHSRRHFLRIHAKFLPEATCQICRKVYENFIRRDDCLRRHRKSRNS